MGELDLGMPCSHPNWPAITSQFETEPSDRYLDMLLIDPEMPTFNGYAGNPKKTAAAFRTRAKKCWKSRQIIAKDAAREDLRAEMKANSELVRDANVAKNTENVDKMANKKAAKAAEDVKRHNSELANIAKKEAAKVAREAQKKANYDAKVAKGAGG